MSDAFTCSNTKFCENVQTILRRFNAVSAGLPDDSPLPPKLLKAAHARGNLVLGIAGVDHLPQWNAASTRDSESESNSDLDLDLESDSESECVELEVASSALALALHSSAVPLAREIAEREMRDVSWVCCNCAN